VWAAGVALLTLVGGLVPLIWNSHYYYSGDTSQGSYGNWYYLGTALRSGRWPTLEPSAWGAGNFIAEGQLGLYSPLSWLVALGSTVATDVVHFASAVKIAYLVVMALGVFLLARSYGVSDHWSAVAGVAVPLGGFTQYMDAPSWTTNLMVSALLPWAWWGIRRYARGRNPFAGLVAIYLLVTVGYVHGTIMLIVVLAGTLLEDGLRRDRRAVLRTVLLGAFGGLVATTVYLPGVLTSDVTQRDSNQIVNSGFMVLDVSGLAASILPTVRAQVIGWWGTFAPGPMAYVAWFVPLLVAVRWSQARLALRGTSAVVVSLVVALAFVLGPSNVGPLRYPMRLMPFVVLTTVLLTVILLDRAALARVDRSRVVTALAIVGSATYLSMVVVPEQWRIQAAVGTAVAVCLVIVMVVLSRHGAARAAVVVAAVSFGMLGVQHHYFDGRETSAAHDYPRALAEYQRPAAGAVNDGIVVGDPADLGPTDEVFDETLVANTWYLNPHVSMQNVYTTIFFAHHARLTCMTHVGATCPQLLDRLFEPEQTTEVPYVDLMSIDTVQILEPTFEEEDLEIPPPPEGWHVEGRTEDTLLWVRDEPVGPTGGPVWASEGTRVTVTGSSPERVTLHVDDVPAGGGEVLFSRLPWPGYTVTGGTLGEPLEGYLLRVEIPASSAGTDVVLSFRPPAWTVQVASLLLAGGLAVALVVTSAVVAVRRRRGAVSRPR
jgi:hypothetical protein